MRPSVAVQRRSGWRWAGFHIRRPRIRAPVRRVQPLQRTKYQQLARLHLGKASRTRWRLLRLGKALLAAVGSVPALQRRICFVSPAILDCMYPGARLDVIVNGADFSFDDGAHVKHLSLDLPVNW